MSAYKSAARYADDPTLPAGQPTPGFPGAMPGAMPGAGGTPGMPALYGTGSMNNSNIARAAQNRAPNPAAQPATPAPALANTAGIQQALGKVAQMLISGPTQPAQSANAWSQLMAKYAEGHLPTSPSSGPTPALGGTKSHGAPGQLPSSPSVSSKGHGPDNGKAPATGGAGQATPGGFGTQHYGTGIGINPLVSSVRAGWQGIAPGTASPIPKIAMDKQALPNIGGMLGSIGKGLGSLGRGIAGKLSKTPGVTGTAASGSQALVPTTGGGSLSTQIQTLMHPDEMRRRFGARLFPDPLPVDYIGNLNKEFRYGCGVYSGRARHVEYLSRSAPARQRLPDCHGSALPTGSARRKRTGRRCRRASGCD